MTAERRRMVACAAAALAALVGARVSAGAPPHDPDDELITGVALSFGPIAGLTTTWHGAPATLPVPAASTVYFVAHKPAQGDIAWSNALEIFESAEVSIAMSPGGVVGDTLVVASLQSDDGEVTSGSCLVTRIDVEIADVTVSTPVLSAPTLPKDPGNDESIEALLGDSIGEVGDGGKGTYVTSIENRVSASVAVTPGALAPVVEWRVDGLGVALGATTELRFHTTGQRNIEAGPPGAGDPVSLTCYRVVILAPAPGEALPEEGPIEATAITAPPGFESRITWLAATAFGDSTPRTGHGPTFTTEFSTIYGPYPADPEGLMALWGIKADNDSRAQREVLFACGEGSGVAFSEFVGRPRHSPPPNGLDDFTMTVEAGLGANGDPCPLQGPQGGAVEEHPYDVEGGTLAEVTEAIFGEGGAGPQLNGAGEHFGGSTELEYHFKWKPCGLDANGDIQVELSEVTWTSHVTLPHWNVPSGLTGPCVTEWDRFVAAVRVHEMGHVGINNGAMAAVRAAFVGAQPAKKISVPGQKRFPRFTADGSPATKADAAIAAAVAAAVKAAINAAPQMAQMRQMHQNYDGMQTPQNPQGTNHGTTQGATLDSTILCWSERPRPWLSFGSRDVEVLMT